MQRIFRSATRRETLGRHSKGGRRGGELKIDWTKPPPRARPMCIDCRLDLWRGSAGVASVSVGNRGMVHGGRMGYHCVGDHICPLDNVRNGPRGSTAPVAWPGQARTTELDLHSRTVLFIMRYPKARLSCVGFAARSRSPACDLGGRLGTPRTTGR